VIRDIEEAAMTMRLEEPFGGAVPESVPLEVTPLTNVLCQIRFPELISIGREEIVGTFQERIRKKYPIGDSAKGLIVVIGDDSTQRMESKIWRFLDADQTWRVTLATEFITLETRNYQSRDEFCERVGWLCAALAETIDPGWMHRIGVRYVNRLHGELYDKRLEFVREDMFGPFRIEHDGVIERTLHQVNATTEEGNMVAKWGYMPKNYTHDPETMPAISTDSWYLDVDSIWASERPVEFDPGVIVQQCGALAGRAYTFFRWGTTQALLDACGVRS